MVASSFSAGPKSSLASPQAVKVFAVSLGCPKNSIDTELALGSLDPLADRWELAETAEKADLLLVNTCGFIEEAVSESIETILSLAAERRHGQILAVIGCMVERYGGELARELPEVDLFLGTRSPEALGSALLAKFPGRFPARVRASTGQGPRRRYLTNPPWRAYLKVSEGCSNRCTYCLIPKLRGRHRSLPLQDILAEAVSLEAAGVQELTLVGQDLTAYSDAGGDLCALLKLLAGKTSVPWIRLLYLNPGKVTPALLETIASHPSICPYLDIPIQHASSRILKSMGRGYTAETIGSLVTAARGILPGASLRTTVMVGFPGETAEDFALLKRFLEGTRFDHLGCFVYSDEDGAASKRLPGKVSASLALERKEEIMALQAEISRDRNRAFVGQTQEVLVEGYSPETDLLLVGRSRYQAPDIDGVVYIASGIAETGTIVPVKITDSHVHDLVGELNDQDQICLS